MRAVSGKRYSIIGAARSGIAAAKLLKYHGADVFVSDASPAAQKQKAVDELGHLNIPCEFGRHSERVLNADVVVLSPGVPNDAAIVKQAKAKGLPVVAEIEVASWFCKGTIVAITGTNGKTTTTALTGRLVEDAKRHTLVAGNIGLAFSEIVGETTEATTTVLEVSSFQLDNIETFRPRVSAVLNITADHLDRYEHAMEKYVAAKCRIFENQQTGDVIVYNYDDEIVRSEVEKRLPDGVHKLPFSTRRRLDEGAFVERGVLHTSIHGKTAEVVATAEISIKGEHNLKNAMAATLAAQALNVSTASIRATLKNFKGVEHRLEFVRELEGVVYVNDSKATNVDSVRCALQSFTAPIVLLLGGRDKGNNYEDLYPFDAGVKAVVAIGESAEKVMAAFGTRKPTQKAMTMEEAVREARRLAVAGDVVLLSPACASFDWFENYEHRGREFKRLVMQL